MNLKMVWDMRQVVAGCDDRCSEDSMAQKMREFSAHPFEKAA
jgi:hypothetical protein